MSEIQKIMMQVLYRRNIWKDFIFDQADVDHQGWNGKHSVLQRIALSATTPLVLDVGVWKGESTLTIAAAMKSAGINGCVISIDTFLGSEEHWNEGVFFTRRAGQPDLYKRFLANVWSQGLQEFIIPMPQTSSTAAKVLQKLGVTVSAVHIDASHYYEDVISDSTKFWNLLTPGGVMVGDDYGEGWPDVVKAADYFSKLVDRPLLVDEPKWIIQK